MKRELGQQRSYRVGYWDVNRRNLWFERLMALIAAAQLGLVLFDLSYVPWRDFWLQGRFQLPLLNLPLKLPIGPQITQFYDPIKGIEPHRDTQQYLEALQLVEQTAQQQGIEAANLATMRQLSQEMLDSNPFQSANKSGTLEKLKNRLRKHISPQTATKTSARDAFNQFWSPQHLTPTRWQTEIAWFNQEITPLLQTNYYRSLGENGDFTNNFGLLEFPFALLFATEFAARTLYLSRRRSPRSADTSWLTQWGDAMVWRWYDVLLFLPFWVIFPAANLLRLIPVALRLDQAKLLSLGHLQGQFNQLFVSSIADELTETVLAGAIAQTQLVLRQGNLSTWLLEALTKPRVEINDTDEVAAISALLLKLVIQDVLPKIEPDVEALLTHTIDVVLRQSPGYSTLKLVPGLGQAPQQITARIVQEVMQSIYKTLNTALEDPTSGAIASQLVQNLGNALATELQQQPQVIGEVQSLLDDLLEEIKLSLASFSEISEDSEPAITAVPAPPPRLSTPGSDPAAALYPPPQAPQSPFPIGKRAFWEEPDAPDAE